MVTDQRYEVTGELTPDATGTYELAGRHDGKQSYGRVPNTYVLWWKDPDGWIISLTAGMFGAAYCARADPDIEGEYQPAGTADGVATVTEI